MARKKRAACDSESCLAWGREFHQKRPVTGKIISYGSIALLGLGVLSVGRAILR